MQPNGKDTIYIDVDDEITTIIDKVVGSKQKVVALVLPKRAAVLQSVVNMKLLKRSADNANKNAVLITTEAALMPLAGAAGLYVAKTPTSKPEIPVTPQIHDGSMTEDDESLDLDDEEAAAYTAENAGDKPVGELAKATAAGAALGAAPDAIETVELDNDIPAADTGKAAVAAAAKKPKSKDPKIPNFSRFQKQLAIGGLLFVVLLIGLYFCLFVLPKATIAIATDATDYNASLSATLDSGASNVSLTKSTIPATATQQQKTYTQQVAASGQQNNGEKATGSVKITNCSDSNVNIPAGTPFSNGSHTYLSQKAVVVPQSNYQFKNGSFTCKNDGNVTTDLVAQKAGADYNTGTTAMTFSGSSSTVTGSGSAAGGTDVIVKVVSQSDIDSAKSKISTEDTSSIKSALAQQLRSNNLYPVQATFAAGTPNVTSSANAGQPADNVTVTETVTYSMYGTQRDYLDQLIKNDIKQQIDPKTQTILSDGLDSATVKLTSSSDTTAQIGLQTTATVGPKLDVASLKEQVKGKKSGYVKSLIGNQPGVTDVTVKLSPFWVSSVPGNTNKVTITVGKAADANGGS